MIIVTRWRWHPQSRPLEQLSHRLLQLAERRLARSNTDDEHQIVARGDLPVLPPNGFAHTPLDPVAVVGLAELFADDEAAARATHAIAGRIQQQKRVRP